MKQRRSNELFLSLAGVTTLFSCLFVGTATAVPVPGTAASEHLSPRFFDTHRSPDFGAAERPLRSLMKEKGVPRGRTDAFCIVGYDYGDAGKIVYVYWQRERQLILWDGGNAPDSLTRARRVLDLRKDVVATDADIRGSTYLVTKAWVARTIADCAAHGRRYRVSRR